MIKLWEQTFRRMRRDLKVHDASYSRSQEGGTHIRNMFMKGHGEKQDWQNAHRAEDSDPESAQISCHQGEEQETRSTTAPRSSSNSSSSRNELVFVAHRRGQI